MIVTKIQGGLGNQMFQFAFGYSLSKKFNQPLRLDRNFYLNQGKVVRSYGLNNFNLNCQDFDPGKDGLGKPWKHVTDPNYFFEISLNQNENYYLDGYWQSQKFFESNLSEIREIFSFSSVNISDFTKKMNLMGSNTVSMHIRRGDYVGANDFHPVQNIEYYEKALDVIGDYQNLLIFSDDIEWCKTNLKFRNINFCEGFNPIEDLIIMSRCSHNIISNSSFSWWAAQLNKNENKKVIAPTKWFGPKLNLETKDIIPESWTKLI